MSEARKNSPSPSPRIRGLSLRAATRKARLPGVDDDQGVRALDFPQGLANGAQVIRPLGQVAHHQVGNDLRVGLGGEAVAGLQQLLLEIQVVLDDAVVDYGDFPHLVGMGVGLGGPPVSGPAGVADAHRARQGLFLQDFFQLPELSQTPANGQAVGPYDRHPG